MVRTLMNRVAALAPNGWTVMAGVASINLLLAVVSFAKDIFFAAYFGTSVMADAVNIAFLLPDTIGSNLIGYVLGIAAVPHLSRIWAAGQKSQFVAVTAGLAVQFSLVLAVLGLALCLFERPVLGWFGQPADAETVRQLGQMFRLLLPCLVFFPLIAIASAALQTTGSFYVPAFGPLLINLAMFVGLAAAWGGSAAQPLGGWIFSYSILLGSALAAFYVWRCLIHKTGEKGHITSKMFPGDTGKFWSLKALLPVYRDFGPLFLVILVTQCLYTVERLLASNLETGTLAGLNYAYRIAQFPNWVFIAALTSVILPVLSRAAGRSSAIREVYRALRLTAIVMVPVALILCLARIPVVTLLLGRGAFGPESVTVTSDLLAGYSLSVVGQAVSMVCLRYFLANGRMRNVVWIYFITIMLAIVFDLWALERWGPASLGYGALLGWSANAALMVGLLVKDSGARKALA